MAIKMKVNTNINFSEVFFLENKYFLKIKAKKRTSPFFYEWVRLAMEETNALGQ